MDSKLARGRCRKGCFPKLIVLNNFLRECLFYIRCFCGKLQGARVPCDFSFWNVSTTLHYQWQWQCNHHMYPGNHTWGRGQLKCDTCKHSNIVQSTSASHPHTHMATFSGKSTQDISSRQTAEGHRGQTSAPQSSCRPSPHK